MNNIRVGHYTQDGSLIYLPLGFIPSRITLTDFHTNTNIFQYIWFSAMETDQGSNKQEGWSIKEGITANLLDDAGIVAYDQGTESPTVDSYTTTVGDAATARTASKAGSFVKPSTTATIKDGSAADRSLIFECVGEGTAVAEPTWPTSVGAQITDGSGGNTFELVVEPTLRLGYQGVRVAAAIQTNGQEMYYEAILDPKAVDQGDVDSWVDGISPNPQ